MDVENHEGFYEYEDNEVKKKNGSLALWKKLKGQSCSKFMVHCVNCALMLGELKSSTNWMPKRRFGKRASSNHEPPPSPLTGGALSAREFGACGPCRCPPGTATTCCCTPKEPRGFARCGPRAPPPFSAGAPSAAQWARQATPFWIFSFHNRLVK